MKSIKIILIVLFLCQSIIYSQNQFHGKIIYKAIINNSKLDENINDKKNSADTKYLMNSLKTQDLEYVLTFNNNESLFIKENKLVNEGDKNIKIAEIIVGKGTYYYSLKTNELLRYHEFGGEPFIISLIAVEWKLSQEKKQIGKYECFKATAIKKIKNKTGEIINKSIIAWYTPEISLNLGPKEFNGLPGMILELDEGEVSFVASKIELNPNVVLTINKPTKGKKVTQGEFEDIVKRKTSNFSRN
ncbi:MAG: GLPGLI family protein [Bacteroidetes bacterium]|nr:GLPGLI family protein [Bacteroidota bacterium]